MPKVYIPNDRHDVAEASRFGELVYLTRGVIDRLDTKLLLDRCEALMRESSADDLLLITSLPIINIIAASILVRRYGAVNLLLYHNRMYLKRTIKIDS